MARSRNIKPGFFTNDVLAEIPPLGRILFQGLWCHADRAGRLENRPKKLKAEILPYDSCDITALLKMLADRRFIVCYAVNNIDYIQVVNFAKHQNPHVNEAASIIPPPDEHQMTLVQAPDDSGTSTVPLRLIPDSLNLIPDSLHTPSAASRKILLSVDGTWKNLDGHLAVWRKAYPALNLEIELNKAAAWILGNPKNRKSNYARFLVNWLSRAQDRAPAGGGNETRERVDNSAVGRVRRANEERERRNAIRQADGPVVATYGGDVRTQVDK